MVSVHITLLYPKLNGSHFGLPPSSIHRMTGLGGNFLHTMTYAHRPHWFFFIYKKKLRKLALVGIIPNHFFSFSSDKDRRTDSRSRLGQSGSPRSGKRTDSLVKVENSHAVPVVAS